jgi:hypothetical protein
MPRAAPFPCGGRERLSGHREFGRRPVRQVLDLADRLPADEADEPAGEGRRARHVLGAPPLEERLEGSERLERGSVSEGTLGREPVVLPLDPAVAFGQYAVRRRADE